MRFWTMLAVATAMAFPAAAADWTVKQEKSYRIELPGAPVTTPMEANPGILSAATYSVDGGDHAVAFTVLELDPAVAGAVAPDVLINAGLDGAIAEMKAVETSRKDVVVKGAALAREVTYTSGAGENPAYEGRGVAAIKGSQVIFVVGLIQSSATAADKADVERAIKSMVFTGP